MASVVVPYRGAAGKRRLARLDGDARSTLAGAMLADVVAACAGAGPVWVVTPEAALAVPATLVADPGGGQAAAVGAGLEAAVAAGAEPPYLVVNADLPAVAAADVAALAAACPEGGLALVPAADGTTNALALADAALFAPLYGPGSAARFARLAASRALDLPGLADDVDTLEDLERLAGRLGPATRRALALLRTGAAA